jgi:hypothetical protein
MNDLVEPPNLAELLTLDAANLLPTELAALARDLTVNFLTHQQILDKHDISETQLQTATQNPFFKKVLESTALEWNSIRNTQDRLRLISAWGLEDTLPVIGSRMRKGSEDLRDVVEAAKLFGTIAGVGGRNPDSQGGGERISISISLGDREVHYEGTASPKDVTPDQHGPPQIDAQRQDVNPPREPQPAGPSSEAAVRPEPEGSKPIS